MRRGRALRNIGQKLITRINRGTSSTLEVNNTHKRRMTTGEERSRRDHLIVCVIWSCMIVPIACGPGISPRTDRGHGSKTSTRE
jgi:hypothetical protein